MKLKTIWYDDESGRHKGFRLDVVRGDHTRRFIVTWPLNTAWRRWSDFVRLRYYRGIDTGANDYTRSLYWVGWSFHLSGRIPAEWAYRGVEG